MRLSQLFGQTLRRDPAEAEIDSHKLLIRAGFIRPLGAGIFTYLPLARRSISKIENILRNEMDTIGGQEISMPIVQPADLWKVTGRWYQIGFEMGRFKDKNDHDMVLALSNEEVTCDLVHHEVQSYKQLPRIIYQIQIKWRDDVRPRAGLIRAREFTLQDSYSFDTNWEGLDKRYRAHYQVYFNIAHRCGLPVIAVKSDTSMIINKPSHEIMYLTPIGEDTLLLCDSCGYIANRQNARFHKLDTPDDKPMSVEKIFTPKCKSINDLAKFLDIPKSKIIKVVLYLAQVYEDKEYAEKFVLAIVRGDMDLNESKLAHAIHAKKLRLASDTETRAIGLEPGFASPIGQIITTQKNRQPIIIVDDIIPKSPNLVTGANEKDYHLINICYGRDYIATIVADITAAGEGAACPECGMTMRIEHGVKIGDMSVPGTRYSDTLGCSFLDNDGHIKPIIMGAYGFAVGRLLACIAEEHHDEHGLIWPVTVAPYQLHLIVLNSKTDLGVEDPVKIAETLYHELQAAGIEVLFDDRDESSGVKFNDADLIGCPIRITISERSLAAGGAEVKLRGKAEKSICSLNETIARTKFEIALLQNEIAIRVTPSEYNG